jgi:hypothetical protein
MFRALTADDFTATAPGRFTFRADPWDGLDASYWTVDRASGLAFSVYRRGRAWRAVQTRGAYRTRQAAALAFVDQATVAARLLAASEYTADDAAEYDDYSRLPRR